MRSGIRAPYFWFVLKLSPNDSGFFEESCSRRASHRSTTAPYTPRRFFAIKSSRGNVQARGVCPCRRLKHFASGGKRRGRSNRILPNRDTVEMMTHQLTKICIWKILEKANERLREGFISRFVLVGWISLDVRSPRIKIPGSFKKSADTTVPEASLSSGVWELFFFFQRGPETCGEVSHLLFPSETTLPRIQCDFGPSSHAVLDQWKRRKKLSGWLILSSNQDMKINLALS